jgi:urea transporter
MSPDPQDPLPQAWVPRVVNLMLAGVFLTVLAPITTTLPDRPGVEQAGIVLFSLPFLLLTVLCLASAIRPGSLGRALRRARARRRG